MRGRKAGNRWQAEYIETRNIVANVEKGDGVTFAPDEEFGWHDITGSIEVRGVAATDPSWSRIGSGPLYAWKFGTSDYVWMTFHIPHDIAMNADGSAKNLYFHTHWLSDGTDTTNTVKWEFVYMYAKGHNQEAFDTAGTTVTTEAASQGQYYHMVSETSGVAISGLTEPDGIIHMRIGRVTNGATDSSDGIFLLTADLHYQSTGLPTKDRSPDFYT